VSKFADPNVPLHDRDLETATIGAALFAPECMARLLEVAEPEDFANVYCRGVMAAARALADDGEPLNRDAIRVVAEAANPDQSEHIGGVMDLAVALHPWAGRDTVDWHVERLRGLRLRRFLERIGQQIVMASRDDTAPQESLETFRQRLLEYEVTRRAGGVRHLRDVLDVVWHDLEAWTEDSVGACSTGMLDLDQMGFEWVDANDQEQSVLSFIRHGGEGTRPVLAVFNFTPLVRHNYRVGVPEPGHWEEILNSDAEEYWGSGQGNFGGVNTSPLPFHGRQQSINVTVPPLGAVFFRSEGTAA